MGGSHWGNSLMGSEDSFVQHNLPSKSKSFITPMSILEQTWTVKSAADRHHHVPRGRVRLGDWCIFKLNSYSLSVQSHRLKSMWQCPPSFSERRINQAPSCRTLRVIKKGGWPLIKQRRHGRARASRLLAPRSVHRATLCYAHLSSPLLGLPA